MDWKMWGGTVLLLGCCALACSQARAQDYAWPWNPKSDWDMKQTGTFFGITADVGTFGAGPERARPVTPEQYLPAAAPPAPPSPAASSTGLLRDPAPSREKEAGNSGAYQFTLRGVQLPQRSSLSTDTLRPQFAVTAFNGGGAPVSLVVAALPQEVTGSWVADQALPLYTVVPANTASPVVNFTTRSGSYSKEIRYSYSWSLGDYRATHRCREGYRLPFANDVKARVQVMDGRPGQKEYTMIFAMPAGTPVLAARKGRVVRVGQEREVDVVHDDGTVASYQHLKAVDNGISVGAMVSTEDVLGVAGGGSGRESYLQFSVWMPHPAAAEPAKESGVLSGFERVTLPVEFCSTAWKGCRVLDKSQTVSRNIPAKGKRPERGN